MKSIITANNGEVRTVYNGTQSGDQWTKIDDDNYIHPRETPSGYKQARYIKSETSRTEFDTETASMGAVHRAIISLDAPDEIPNDGSPVGLDVQTQSGDAVTAQLSVGDFTDTVTIDNNITEQISTTVPAGETISIVINGVEVDRESITIEVVEA